MKTYWRVQAAPTGRYRSFERRGWPQLLYQDGRLAASLDCEDDYVPSQIALANHGPIAVVLYDYSLGIQLRKCRRLVKRFGTLSEAKAAAETTLKAHPHFMPNEAHQDPAS